MRWPASCCSAGSARSASLSAPSSAASAPVTPWRSSSRRVPRLIATMRVPRGGGARYFRPSRTAVGLMKIAISRLPEGLAAARGSISMAGKRSARPPSASIIAANPCAREAGRVTTIPLSLKLTQVSLKDIQRALVSQIVGCALAKRLRLRRIAGDVGSRDAPAIGRGDQRTQEQPLTLQLCERTQWDGAAAAEHSAYCAFRTHAGCGTVVDERREQRGNVRARSQAFDAQRTLAGRRQAFAGI